MSTIKKSKLKPGVYYVPKTEVLAVIECPRLQIWINVKTLKEKYWETATIETQHIPRTKDVRIECVKELVWVGEL